MVFVVGGIMETPLFEKVAIVTGAGRGIGRAIAIALAGQGARVSLAARTEEELEDTASSILADGGQARIEPTDVTVESSVCRLVEHTLERWGRLDIVVNNAGTGVFGSLEKTTTDDWNRILEVNSRGAFWLCREAIPHLRKQRISYIVNIASVVAVKGYQSQSAYAASKHALLGMSKSLSKEVQQEGIRVHVINPGGVDTDMARQARPDIDPSNLMLPQEIADIVVFLVTRTGNSVIDEVNVHRANATPWA